jgi:sugar phosphate isomerase/epimerase
MIGRHDEMRYGFSSIGCPDASLQEMEDLAAAFELDFVELRALGGTIDLPAYFAKFQPEKPKVVEVRLVATNLHLMTATDQDIEVFLRYAALADKLGSRFLRVFGGGKWGDPLTESGLNHAADVVQLCRAALHNQKSSCEMLLETHSAFSASKCCLVLNEKLEEPIRILWDAHHTWRSAGESPRHTWRQIGHLVRHMHVSDSRAKPAEPGHQPYDCILPGTGEYPMAELRELLTEVGFSYGVSLEWEKLWHPHLPEVPEALQRFTQIMR